MAIKMSPAELVARLAAEYQHGATSRELAGRYGLDQMAVLRRLSAAGVEIRQVGPQKKPTTDAQIIAWRHQGYTWSQVAEFAGMSSAGVRRRYAIATADPAGSEPAWTRAH